MPKGNVEQKIRSRYIISIILFIFAITFSLTINDYTLGDKILCFFNIPCWSNGSTGTHYTFLYTIVLCIISYFIMPKVKKH